MAPFERVTERTFRIKNIWKVSIVHEPCGTETNEF